MQAGLACCMPDWNGWKNEKPWACAGPAAALCTSMLPLAEAAACGGGSLKWRAAAESLASQDCPRSSCACSTADYCSKMLPRGVLACSTGLSQAMDTFQHKR